MTEIIVETKQGKLRGTSLQDYYGGEFFGFLGVPYAKAPVGNLRFKAPEPPESWEGTRDATKEGPECPSWEMYFAYYVGQEDNCLNLNVFTKKLPKGQNFKKKPVMVWIHGGGFKFGSNKMELFGPQYLMTQDIVLVAPNYRLGVLGFLSLKDPELGIPGNAGLKDQVMALRWVQSNIEKFGGDPNNVTVFGESAGGGSVHYLTMSPITKGLFHKAIIQSGCALSTWAKGKHNAIEIAQELGYKERDEKTIIEKLQKEAVKKIVNAQYKIIDYLEAGVIRPFGPVVEPQSENAFLTKTPLEILEAGEQHQIPLIIGYNSLEGIFFELIKKSNFLPFPTDLVKDMPLDLGLELNSPECKELAEKVREFYYGDEKILKNKLERLYEVKGDVSIVYKIHKTVELLQQTSTQPVYMYRMSLESSLNVVTNLSFTSYFVPTHFLNFLTKLSYNYVPSLRTWFQWMATSMPETAKIDGVCHADDIFYLFKIVFSPEVKTGSDEDKYIQRFVRLWTNFARCGDPTPVGDEVVGTQKWTSVDSTRLRMLDLGKELRMVGNEAEEKRVKFWDEVYKKYTK